MVCDYPCDLQSTDRFEVVEKISRGGSGDVWLAFDSSLFVEVAIKRIYNWVSDQPQTISRLQAEVVAGRSIHSPHVLRIYDLLMINCDYCLIMAYVKGKTLDQALRTTISPIEAKLMARQLCIGLAAIHEAGFAHRDLKPTNVLVDQAGTIVIADLGLAGIVAEARSSSSHYISPELGRPSNVLSDIYALGALIADIAAAAGLFGDGTKNLLTPILAKCRDSAPERRYQSVRDILADLDRCWLPPPLPPPSRWLLRGRSLLSSALILVLISFGFLWRRPATVQRRNEMTQWVVMSNTDDPRARMIVDLISTYLEMNRIAISRPPQFLDDHALASVRGALRPSTILVSLERVPGRLVARLDLSSGRQKSSIVTPVSNKMLAVIVSSLGAALHLGASPLSFDLPAQDGMLDQLAYAWTHSEISSSLEQMLQQQPSPTIPWLLLTAKANLQRFALTGADESRALATQALDELKTHGISCSQMTLLRAALLRHQKGTLDAVRCLQNSLDTLTTTAPIYKSLSDQELRDGFGREALDSGLRAVTRDPFSSQAYLTLARAQIDQGQDDNAIRSLETALLLNEKDANTHITLGNLNILLSKFAEARLHLERAMELKPTAEGYIYVGLADILSGQTQQGLLILKGAAAAKPSLYSLGTLGAALRWEGHFDEARGVFERALRAGHEDSTDPIELGRLAVVHAQLLRIKRADALLRRAARYISPLQTELLYDAMIVDAFADRRKQCVDKFGVLAERRFPVAFALRDPQIARFVTVRQHP